MLFRRMIGIVKIDIERVIEYRGSFLKRNSMFLEVTRCLFIIPLLRHEAQYNTVGSRHPRWHHIILPSSTEPPTISPL